MTLTTVPTLLFPNGEEMPIQVSFYNGSIELKQVFFNSDEHTISLSPERIVALLNAIKKHQKEAEKILNR